MKSTFIVWDRISNNARYPSFIYPTVSATKLLIEYVYFFKTSSTFAERIKAVKILSIFSQSCDTSVAYSLVRPILKKGGSTSGEWKIECSACSTFPGYMNKFISL